MTKEKYATLNNFQKVDYFFFGGGGTISDRVWYYGGMLLMSLIGFGTIGVVTVWNILLEVMY